MQFSGITLSLQDDTVCFQVHAKGNSFCNNESEIVFSVFIRSSNISVAGQATLGLYNNILQWFDAQYKTCLNLSAEDVLLNIYDPNPNCFTSQMNQILSLLLMYVKLYLYINKNQTQALDADECIYKFLAYIQK